MQFQVFIIVVGLSFWPLSVFNERLFGQNMGASLEELLQKTEYSPSEPDSEVVARWNAVVSAFARADEETGKSEGAALAGLRGRLNPRQVEAVSLLLQLAEITDGVPADASVDQLKKRGQEALAEVNKANTQLAKIEAGAAKLPKTFSSGTQVHVQWVQLQRENEHWKERKEQAQNHYDALKADFDQLKNALFGQLEKQLLPLIDDLAHGGEIEAAIAMANTYIRKNSKGAAVSAKGDELIALRKKEAFVRELVSAIEKEVEPLLIGRRISAAAAKFEEGARLVLSRLTDDKEKEIFTRLIQVTKGKLDAMINEGNKRLDDALSAVSKDVDEGRDSIKLVEEIWVDNSELDSLRVKLASTARHQEAMAAEKRITAIEKIAESDVVAAQGLLKELEGGLSLEDRAIIAARIQAVANRLWDAELESLRADIDEAHRFLTTESEELAELFQNGNDPAFKRRLKNIGATENIIRARTLLEGVVARGNLVESELKEPRQKARVRAILETASKGSSMLQVEAERVSRGGEEWDNFRIESSGTTLKTGLTVGAVIMAILGCLLVAKSRRNGRRNKSNNF